MALHLPLVTKFSKHTRKYGGKLLYFFHFLFFDGLQTSTIIKPKYSTICCSDFPPSVSLLPSFYLMKRDENIRKGHVGNAHCKQQNTQTRSSKSLSSMNNYFVFGLELKYPDKGKTDSSFELFSDFFCDYPLMNLSGCYL